MKKLLVWSVVFLSTVIATKAQVNYRMNENGLQFYFAYDSTGLPAMIGELVSLDMVISDENGNEIKNSYSSGKPVLFPVRISSFPGDIYEAVRMMSNADSALFKISADSMYQHVFRKDLPSSINEGSFLDVTIKVHFIKSQKKHVEDLQEQAESEEISEKEFERRELELVNIRNYIKNEGYVVDSTESGVYYQIQEMGKGVAADSNSTILMNYDAYLMDGTLFESTYNEDGVGRPVSFVLGKQQVIQGWEDVLPLVKDGTHLYIIVPSHLAFGKHEKQGYFPAHSVLIFDVMVVGVR